MRTDYRFLLVGVLVIYVLIIVVPAERAAGPLRVALLSLMLVVAVRMYRRVGRSAMALGMAGGALTVATAMAGLFGSTELATVIAGLATAGLVAAIAIVIGRSIVGATAVTGATIRAALTVYLLFALFFGALHELAGAIQPGYLHGTTGRLTGSTALYFSIITMTTVGYGDLTPGTNLARAVASTEALLGQLYLVSVVALVMARYQRPTRPGTGVPDPPDMD